jgi:hypothetical protein
VQDPDSQGIRKPIFPIEVVLPADFQQFAGVKAGQLHISMQSIELRQRLVSESITGMNPEDLPKRGFAFDVPISRKVEDSQAGSQIKRRGGGGDMAFQNFNRLLGAAGIAKMIRRSACEFVDARMEFHRVEEPSVQHISGSGMRRIEQCAGKGRIENDRQAFLLERRGRKSPRILSGTQNCRETERDNGVSNHHVDKVPQNVVRWRLDPLA